MNKLTHNYYSYTPAAVIEKELHFLLIGTNVSNYIEWMNKSKRDFQSLTDSTLRKVYHELVRQYKHKELAEFLECVKIRGFNPEYTSIEVIVNEIKKDSALKGL